MAFNVLIVDDSSTMRSVVKRAIRISGFDVGEYWEAADGKEALEKLGLHWIDVVLTDINMPKLNGMELVARIKEDEVLRTIPVIMVSTEGSETKVQEALRLGASGYIKKPFHPEEIKRTLGRIMGEEKDEGRKGTRIPEGSDF